MRRKTALWLVGAALATTLFLRFCVVIVPPDAPVGGQPERASPARHTADLIVPVLGVSPDKLTDTFTQARDEGERRHDAIDIPALSGTPVVAAASGRVEKLFVSEQGGNTVYIRSADRRWSYYYAHLDRYAAGLREGRPVGQGATLGTVGATGNADPSGPHLHFAINAMNPHDRWWQGTPINPYPLLAVAQPVASR